jgi:uncharacterized protein YjbI with pentapeptide repeats
MTGPAESPALPYKGRHPFADTREDALLFFGREDEARALLHVVAAERLSALCARSGLGKTSLINARLMKGLRESGYFPAAVRLTQDKERNPLRSICQGVLSEARRQGVQVSEASHDSLWQFFCEARFTQDGEPRRPVLILDQFEELFTIVREGSQAQFADLVGQLADLVRGRMPAALQAAAVQRLEQLPDGDPERKLLAQRLYGDASPDIRVLLSFREDFLPEMEALQDRIPGVFRNVVRLKPLSRTNAEAAIAKPGQTKEILGENQTFEFEPAAVKQILDFLGAQAKGKRMVAGEEIEPMHLQLLCHELDHRRRLKKAAGARRITVADLGGERGMRRILGRHYRSVLKRFPRIRPGWNARRWRPSATNLLLFHCPRRAVRKLCQSGLLTASGRRNIVMADEARQRYGVGDAELALLVKERLLRREPRLGSEFYELAHDSLVAPLLSIRRRRRIAAATLLVAFLVVPYAYALVGAVRDGYRVRKSEEKRRQDLAMVRSTDVQGDQRNEAFARLVKRSADLTHQEFSGVELRRGAVSEVNFSHSRLQNAVFDRTTFIGARFDGADLSGASFVECTFSDSILAGARLVGANLRRAQLAETQLRGADLQGATLAEADLTDAQLAGANVDAVDFKDTEWWLARGFTDQQLKELESRWPHNDFAGSARYRDAVEARGTAVEGAALPSKQADLLNDLAWYRAIRGADLPQALRDAARAIDILEHNPDYRLPLVQDTLGYIQLQRGENQEALATFSKIKWDVAWIKGDMLYHYALALQRAGQLFQAKQYFKRSAEKGYEPTHERLLVPQRWGTPPGTKLGPSKAE